MKQRDLEYRDHQGADKIPMGSLAQQVHHNHEAKSVECQRDVANATIAGPAPVSGRRHALILGM